MKFFNLRYGLNFTGSGFGECCSFMEGNVALKTAQSQPMDTNTLLPRHGVLMWCCVFYHEPYYMTGVIVRHSGQHIMYKIIVQTINSVAAFQLFCMVCNLSAQQKVVRQQTNSTCTALQLCVPTATKTCACPLRGSRLDWNMG